MALKVKDVLMAWKQFQLHNTQQEIDEAATEVTAKQDESDASRKKLVEFSKEFKKNTAEDTRKQVAPLLKSFQGEVDNLTKRAKFAETSFLKVYKKIIDITDPLPSLEYCIGLEKKLGKYVDLEIENKNLRETLQDYNEEFREVRNQDVTIKNLKEKVKKYEEKLDESVSSRAKEVERDLHSQYSEKERLLQETQNSVMRRLRDAETRATTLQETLEQTQSELFEYKSKSEESNAAHHKETDILALDLERVNQQSALADKEVLRLQEVVAKTSNESHNSSVSQIDANAELLARASLEVELSVKDKEIGQLVEDVKKFQEMINKMRDQSQNKMQNLETELNEKTAKVDKLKLLLDKQKDYQEVKRELTIIKSVEFGVETQTKSQTNEDFYHSKPLEILLMGKNKALQNENTVLKQANLDLTKHISESNQELSTLRSLSSEQKVLITQLEADVASMQSFSSLYRGEGEGCPSMPEIVAEAVKGTEVAINISSGITDQTLLSTSASPVPGHYGGGGVAQSAAESLLPIITAQRERFKVRKDELEAELTVKNQQVITIQNELDNLRSDNVKLYEKIRFLHSYRGEHSVNTTTAESRYSSQYEDSLDPFSSFSRKEKLRHYSALSPFEKLMLSMGRFLLGSKTGRSVAFLYTALLHGLVFVVLYKMAHTESCKRDVSADCAQKFAEHMQDVHGEKDFHG